MIQYIVAAGLGALLGKKARSKSFARGGQVITYEVSNIEYDTDGERFALPDSLTIEVPADLEGYEADEYISDRISDITGFAHMGFSTTPEIVYASGGRTYETKKYFTPKSAKTFFQGRKYTNKRLTHDLVGLVLMPEKEKEPFHEEFQVNVAKELERRGFGFAGYARGGKTKKILRPGFAKILRDFTNKRLTHDLVGLVLMPKKEKEPFHEELQVLVAKELERRGFGFAGYARGGQTGMSQLKAAELFEMQMTSVSKALDRADLELSRTGDFGNAFSAVAQARDHAMYMRRFATFMGAPRSLKGLIDALRDNLDQLQRDIKVGLKVEGYNTERPLVGISAAQRRLADIQALFMETTQEALRNEDN